MGNLNNQCLSSTKPTDIPIICEIFNDTGTYITSCYSHDSISYIKQCYVESCDPPPLPQNIILKLLANPTFNNLKPCHSHNTEASKSSSPAFSYVSHSNNTLQRVILLDDTDTMAKYKKYSLSMQKYSNKDNDNDEAKRLIFQIRIEHISSKNKKSSKCRKSSIKMAHFDRKRSNSTSTTINTNTMRQMYQSTGNMTPSDAYSVVSMESTASLDTHYSHKSHKKNKKDKRKKYKLRRKVINCHYIDEVDEETEEKSNIPLIINNDETKQDDSAALDQFEAMISKSSHHKDISTSINSNDGNHSASSVRIIRRAFNEEEDVHTDIATPQHPPLAIPVVSSSDDNQRNTNIIRSDRARRERKRSNSFGPTNNCGEFQVFPLSLIYGGEHEDEGSQSYYQEHSYDNAIKFSMRKIKAKYGLNRNVKLSRRSNKKGGLHGHSYSDREYSHNSLIGLKEDIEDDNVMYLDSSSDSRIHQASQPPPEPFDDEEDQEIGPQSMKLDVFKMKGVTKFKRIRNLIDEPKKKRKKKRKKRKRNDKVSVKQNDKVKSKKKKDICAVFDDEKLNIDDREHSITVTTTFKRIEEKLETGMIEPGSTQYQQELDDAMNKLKRKHKKLANKANKERARDCDLKRYRSSSHRNIRKHKKEIKKKSKEESGIPVLDFSASFSEKYRSSLKKKNENKKQYKRRINGSLKDKKQYKQNKPHPYSSYSSRKEGQQFISKRRKYDKYDKAHRKSMDKTVENKMISDS